MILTHKRPLACVAMTALLVVGCTKLQVENLPSEAALPASEALIDDNTVFVGSANLDPRSLIINTEVGLVIDSMALNRALRELLVIDFEPRNAWAVQLSDDGKLVWVGDDQVLTHNPDSSLIQRLEDWFVGRLPIDGLM